MISTTHALLIILIVAAVTFATRLLPFVFWGNGQNIPHNIVYIGKVLPPAVMAMLIVYSLRGTDVFSFPFGLPELIAVAAVVFLHLWKRNNLLSILGGTAFYMVLVQFIFI